MQLEVQILRDKYMRQGEERARQYAILIDAQHTLQQLMLRFRPL